jgi:hypothetical protein
MVSARSIQPAALADRFGVRRPYDRPPLSKKLGKREPSSSVQHKTKSKQATSHFGQVGIKKRRPKIAL